MVSGLEHFPFRNEFPSDRRCLPADHFARLHTTNEIVHKAASLFRLFAFAFVVAQLTTIIPSTQTKRLHEVIKRLVCAQELPGVGLPKLTFDNNPIDKY